MNDIAHELNITNNMENEQLEYGEVDAYADAEGDHRIQVGQYKYSFSNGTTVVLEIDRARNSIEHVYKEDEDGKLVPVCLEHVLNENIDLSNEKDVIEKILPNEEIKTKVEEENTRPEGGRTRGDEAYSARFGE